MVCHQTSVGSLPRAAFSGVTRPGAMYGLALDRVVVEEVAVAVADVDQRIVSCFAGQRRFGFPP